MLLRPSHTRLPFQSDHRNSPKLVKQPQPRQESLRFVQRQHKQQSWTATAALPEGLDSWITTGTLAASGLCVLGSAALAVRAPPQREDADSQNTEYGIMGVISCIPLVNWTVRTEVVTSMRTQLCKSGCACTSAHICNRGMQVYLSHNNTHTQTHTHT
jgi:hypothetical protein